MILQVELNRLPSTEQHGNGLVLLATRARDRSEYLTGLGLADGFEPRWVLDGPGGSGPDLACEAVSQGRRRDVLFRAL